MPEISVIMTVHNGMPFVREAVESVLGQTFDDFEFIIVDNASADQTQSLLERYRAKDSRIRLFLERSDLGQTMALNKAVEHAKGRYLARMDADDVSLPDRLAVQRAFMRSHPQAGAVGSWHEEMTPSGRSLKVMRYPAAFEEIQFHLVSDGNLTRRCFSHPTAFLSKEAFQNVGGYNERFRYAQDYDLWTRMARSYEIHNVARVLLRYRASPHSSSQRNRPAMEEELNQIVSSHIRAAWPDIPDEKADILRAMLRNQAPPPKARARDVFDSFDVFFQKRFGTGATGALVQARFQDMIKLYYLPRLLRVDPLGVLVFFWRALWRWPSLLLSPKLFKNILKGIYGDLEKRAHFAMFF